MHVFNGCCFQNAYKTALCLAKNNVNCKILTGKIFSLDENIYLHSFVVVNDEWVIDYVGDTVMSKNLFFSCFPFETLNEISGQEILQSNDVFNTYYFSDSERNLCFQYIVDQIKNNPNFKTYKLSPNHKELYAIYQQRFENVFIIPKLF